MSATTWALAPGYVRRHLHRRRRDVGILRDRQHERRHAADQQDDDRHHPGEDRTIDEELGEHAAGAQGWRAGRVRFRSPWERAVGSGCGLGFGRIFGRFGFQRVSRRPSPGVAGSRVDCPRTGPPAVAAADARRPLQAADDDAIVAAMLAPSPGRVALRRHRPQSLLGPHHLHRQDDLQTVGLLGAERRRADTRRRLWSLTTSRYFFPGRCRRLLRHEQCVVRLADRASGCARTCRASSSRRSSTPSGGFANSPRT